MSKSTKRKHVTKEILEDYYIPENGEEIVRIAGGRGNNLHEVESSSGMTFLVSMPTKFRKNVWVKRGDYVIISPIKEGNKVQGEIVYILFQKQIKYLKDENLWPSGFNIEEENEDEVCLEKTFQQNQFSEDEKEISSEDEYNDDDLFENPNHRPIYLCEESDSESSDDDESNKSSDDDEEVRAVNQDNKIQCNDSIENDLSKKMKDVMFNEKEM